MSLLAEVEWDFDGEDANWRWLNEHANFSHREACEFIVHIGRDPNDDPADPPYWQVRAKEMEEGGCSKELIATYLEAQKAGAVRILFYA